jgi:alcohol dehydrogenase class IV
MTCGHLYADAGLESAFTIDASRVTFGVGALHEVGPRLAALAGRRVALFTDAQLRALPWFEDVETSLRAAGLEPETFDEVSIEPTDASIERAIEFASELKPDAYVSLGGGSVIDTAKLANLVASHPAPLMDYVNAPLGKGVPVPGPLAPHIACPTTSGTGSEVTGIGIFDILDLHAKSGVASAFLRPTEALVDPRVTATLPGAVVAASGLDVLCHALESFTARPYVKRPASEPPTTRPMSQGANPWSDMGCREAIALVGRYLRRAVNDPADAEARHHTMWAATLAGIAFGNAGVHVPHAMAYAIGGHKHVPHGFAVAVNAPAAFRFLAETSPERHDEAAALLGADDLANAMAALMRDVGAPNGAGGVGYAPDDIPRLVASAAPQRRLLDNAPAAVAEAELETLFRDAMTIWRDEVLD